MCSGCSRTRTCFFGQEYKKTKLNMKNVLQGLAAKRINLLYYASECPFYFHKRIGLCQ